MGRLVVHLSSIVVLAKQKLFCFPPPHFPRRYGGERGHVHFNKTSGARAVILWVVESEFENPQTLATFIQLVSSFYLECCIGPAVHGLTPGYVSGFKGVYSEPRSVLFPYFHSRVLGAEILLGILRLFSWLPSYIAAAHDGGHLCCFQNRALLFSHRFT